MTIKFSTQKFFSSLNTFPSSVFSQKIALSGPPDVVVSTPACIHSCLSSGSLQPKAILESLSMLIPNGHRYVAVFSPCLLLQIMIAAHCVYDSVDGNLLLSYGYEDDLRALTAHVPRSCQCLLMSATSTTAASARTTRSRMTIGVAPSFSIEERLQKQKEAISELKK
ncbi:hypothetical protein Cgig2_025102 [Carnegiea gigantea]|uniref:Uncharacterized protein n=1 Tax=Carnegiea gigantea TaxID=171969 RepID=A0A9Q1KGX1_9CARY|nr:hypothetical protein Cgig2_025102 [Carnegiea gigantea]